MAISTSTTTNTTTTATTTSEPDNPADHHALKTLLACSLQDTGLASVFHVPRFRLRLRMVREWGVRAGERLLDIGCGQGESLLALAWAVGPSGHVTGLDTASMDYGHPFTMRDAHAHIRASELGPRISFYGVDAAAFFASSSTLPEKNGGETIDAAVLCQSLFYFPDEADVRALFCTLAAAKVARLYVSEWDYAASSRPQQRAHVLAARAQALFYRYRTPRAPGLREQNVRAGVDRGVIEEAARAAGYHVGVGVGVAQKPKTDPDPEPEAKTQHHRKETVFTPADDMREGQFEVDRALSDAFDRQLVGEGLAPRQEDEIRAILAELKDEVAGFAAKEGDGFARAMDVWCAVFELGQVGERG